MNIKEQLPGFVLADLYSKSLVCINDEVEKNAVDKDQKEADKKYLGDYKSKIIVLVNNADNMYLNEKDFSFLSGILNACKLKIEHVALINFNNNSLSFFDLKKSMHPKFLLLFSVTALQIELPFTMPDYQVQQYDNCQILTAPSLSVIDQSKTEKTKLWKSLQKMFNLEK